MRQSHLVNAGSLVETLYHHVITRTSLQSLVGGHFSHAAEPGCAPCRSDGLRDSHASSHGDVGSTYAGLESDYPDSRHRSGGAASAIAFGVPAGKWAPSNIVASAPEGVRGRGGRTRRTDGQVS